MNEILSNQLIIAWSLCVAAGRADDRMAEAIERMKRANIT